MKTTFPYLVLAGLLISGVSISQIKSNKQFEAAQLSEKQMVSQIAEKEYLPIEAAQDVYKADRLVDFAPIQDTCTAAPYPKKDKVKRNASSCRGGGSSNVGLLIETIKVPYLEPLYSKAEIQVAEIIYEEPIKLDYEVKTYPNPFAVQSTLEIANYDGEPYTFVMFDLSGKLIDLRESVTDNRLTIERGDLASGIYIWKLVTASESQVKSGKVVVQ